MHFIMRTAKRLDAPFWGSLVISLVFVSSLGCFAIAAIQ